MARLLRHGRWLLLGLYVTALISLTVAWHDPAWRQYLQPTALAQMARGLAAMPMGSFLILAGYIVAVVLAVPVAVLVLVGALVFGPWPGMLYTLCGMVSGAVVTYAFGHFTAASLVETFSDNDTMRKLDHAFKKRGLMTVIIVRVLPIAPFVMVNMVAGAFKVPLRDFVLGSFIGLLPATLMASLFADRLTALVNNPSAKTIGAAVVTLLLIGLAIWWFKRRLSRTVLD
jgi:uncharacterized membrane protein YdjX (TVP38/TMEM64 family)